MWVVHSSLWIRNTHFPESQSIWPVFLLYMVLSNVIVDFTISQHVYFKVVVYGIRTISFRGASDVQYSRCRNRARVDDGLRRCWNQCTENAIKNSIIELPLPKDDIMSYYGPTRPLFAFDVVSVQRQTRMALKELRYETKLLNFPSSLMVWRPIRCAEE